MKTIVVAGGTGLIGKRLVELLRTSGYKVNVLSRNPQQEGEFQWDPREGQIDEKAIAEASVFVTVQPDGEVRADTVGVPAPGVELRIADNGEVFYKSPGAFVEYYKNPVQVIQEAARVAKYGIAMGMMNRNSPKIVRRRIQIA